MPPTLPPVVTPTELEGLPAGRPEARLLAGRGGTDGRLTWSRAMAPLARPRAGRHHDCDHPRRGADPAPTPT